MINDLLSTFSDLITDNLWIAPLLAILAGIITSVMPCSLSTVPLVIGYVGGAGRETKSSFKLSVAFALGMAATFTFLGALSAILGRLLGITGSWWYIILGVIMVLMALQTWELYNFIPSTYLTGKATKKGYTGAFLVGILGGFFSSPCATPVLVVLLGIVARSGNIVWGILLLLLYAAGHSVLVVIAGTSVGFVRKLTAGNKYGTLSRAAKYIMGSIILLIGFYMFYLAF